MPLTEDAVMSQIRTVERYVFDGVEYSTLREIQRVVEDRIGKIIDTVDFLGSVPKVRLSVLDVLILHREELAKLLDVCFTLQAEYATDDDIEINILAYKR